jgi:tetratricopeptide (TPR) repeat protein
LDVVFEITQIVIDELLPFVLKKEYYYNRGAAYAQSGQYQNALEDMKKVLGLDPTHENALDVIRQIDAILAE